MELFYFFKVLQISLLFILIDFKKCTVNCTSVLLVLLFT